MKSFVFIKYFLVVLLLLNGVGAWADTFVKVSSAPSDWSGEYLVVYEESSTLGLAWNGLDKGRNTVAYQISDGKIYADNATTIIVNALTYGYSVKVNGGINKDAYISATEANNLPFSSTSSRIDFKMLSNGKVSLCDKDKKYYLLFNKNVGVSLERFRFYSSSNANLSSYSDPFLYKKVEEESPRNIISKVSYGDLFNSITSTIDLEGRSLGEGDALYTFAKGNGDSSPKFEDGVVKTYGGNQLTISANQPIEAVLIHYTSDAGADENNALSTGSMTISNMLGTWMIGGVANIVTYTFGSACSFDKITVYYHKSTFTVGSLEWGTYYLDKAFVMPEGARGLTVSLDSAYKLVLNESYRAGDVVPANVPLLINAPQGTYTCLLTSEGGTEPETNYLRGQLTAGEITPETVGNFCYYKLTTGSDKESVNYGKLGFYWGAAGGAVFAMKNNNRAYLVLPKSAGVKSFVFDGDEETAVQDVRLNSLTKGNAYSVQGFRWNGPSRIIIRDSKKMLMK